MSRLAQPNKAVPPIVAGVLVLALVTSLIIWNQSGPQADPKPQAKTQVDPYANLDLEQPQPSYQLLRYVADNGGDDFQRRLSIQWLADFGRLRSKPTASQESWLLSLIESGGHPDWDIETTLWLFNNTFNVLHNGKEPAGLTRQLNHLATQHPDMTMRLYALQHLEVQRNQGRLTGALADETRVMLKHHAFDEQSEVAGIALANLLTWDGPNSSASTDLIELALQITEDSHRPADVRVTALHAIGEHALELSRRLASDAQQVTHVRKAAIACIGQHGNQADVQTLQALSKENFRIAQAAKPALAAIRHRATKPAPRKLIEF